MSLDICGLSRQHLKTRVRKEPPARIVKGNDGSQCRHIVRIGDAFDLLDEIDHASVDLLITSPPYWGHRSYGRDHNWSILQKWKAAGGTAEKAPGYDWYRNAGGILGLEPFPDWYVAHLAEILDKARPTLKISASVWINIGDTYFARWASIRENGRQGLGDNPRIRRRTPMGDYRQEKQLLMIPARFAIEMQARRWILRNDLIWFKPNIPPRPETDRLRLSHEHFFHFVLRPKEGRARYHYDLAAAEPHAHDVISVPVRAGQNGHSATFPEELVRPRILSSCPPNGLVLDPFCGTGRALTVAAESGRRAIGFDISPDYADETDGMTVSRQKKCPSLVALDRHLTSLLNGSATAFIQQWRRHPPLLKINKSGDVRSFPRRPIPLALVSRPQSRLAYARSAQQATGHDRTGLFVLIARSIADWSRT